MSAITRFFFRTPYEVTPSTPWSIIQWWESRRVVYNVAVGAAGLLTLTAVAIASTIPPRMEGIPWIAIAVYAAMANLFYSAGPILDIAINSKWGREYSAVGAALFRYGFVFSVGLTLLPIPVVTILKILRIVTYLAGVEID